jgi:hypothetical protein
MRQARPFESERELARDAIRSHRVIQIQRELDTFDLPEPVEKLLSELDQLANQYVVWEMDHVLKIAGHLCMQAGQAELWEQIYRATLDGCQVKPGDEMRFLDPTLEGQ